MKKIIFASLILSLSSNFALAEDVKYQPSEREIDFIKLMLTDDINTFSDGGESSFANEYKNDSRFNSLKPISSDEILKTYSENEVRGDKYYKNKELVVSGTIKSIDSGFGDEPYITFTTKNKYSFNAVQAHFVKDEYDKLIDLNKGKKIEISCVGGGEIAGSPMLKRCNFFDKNKAVNGIIESYISQVDKLNAGKIDETSHVVRQLAFMTAILFKATNNFSSCPEKIELKCVENAVKKISTKDKEKYINELKPLSEYLQLEKK
ncbi:hypothetical protein FXB93_02600 [Aggregatibacter actinomycetemcomitans]|uniref:OB-fold protein n=1 Tax=Aggregatibacter actinomycetemcomitans TaxID=714 RepID=UPI0011D775AD|nr:hypothetical protein [Aggregatibacter actinomycetemcomitans]TYB02311.1 hypothetical protein FXB93_02600 [Aggregatibacter actinomycetemcomitans]